MACTLPKPPSWKMVLKLSLSPSGCCDDALLRPAATAFGRERVLNHSMHLIPGDPGEGAINKGCVGAIRGQWSQEMQIRRDVLYFGWKKIDFIRGIISLNP